MSKMSTLDQLGITVEEISAYLKEHLGIRFDEAVRDIENKQYTQGGDNDEEINPYILHGDELERTIHHRKVGNT